MKTQNDQPSLSITFVRHGQTAWNANAESDASDWQELTPLGRQQITDTARLLEKQPAYDALYASPLSRAHESLSILKAHLAIDVDIQESPLLAERDYGQQQPQSNTVTPGQGYNPFIYPLFTSLPDSQKWLWKPYEDFESDSHIVQRFDHFLQIVQGSPARRVLAVTHAGFLRVVLMHYGYIGYDDWNTYHIDNASAYRLDLYGEEVLIQKL